ncbi:hypothetical protein D3C84_1104830 [compost metagenome]
MAEILAWLSSAKAWAPMQPSARKIAILFMGFTVSFRVADGYLWNPWPGFLR